MKKIFSILAASGMAIAAATTASADINVAWAGSFGFIPEGGDGSVGILGSGESTVAQLIFSTDDMIGEALVGGETSGDDYVLATFNITNSGGAFEDYASFSAPNFVTGFQTGYVYGRIFDSDNVVAGTKYYNGPIVATQDIIPPASPQSYDLNTNFVTGNALDMTVVPEPTTLALLVLGVGTMVFRRRRAA